MKLRALLILSLVAGCSSVPENVEPNTEDNGDGTWSFELGDEFDPSAEMVREGVTWRYVGQARYDYAPRPVSGPVTYVYDGEVLSPAEQVRQTEMEDAEGRRWVPVRFDDRVTEALTELGAAVSPEVPLDHPEADEIPEPEKGDVLTWYPTSWDKRDCDGDGDDDWWVWDSDDRNVLTSPSAPRQRTAVTISSTAGGCSGTVLRNQWVLTAAHCTFTASGASASGYSAQNWAGENVGVSLVLRGPGYSYGSNGWDPDDDYVLLKLSSTFPTATGDMNISNASDSRINDVNPKFHNLGFPARRNSCLTINNSLVHTANNDITGKNSRNIRWKGDSGAGHSGGPIYYCPGAPDIDACDSDDTGFVVGVVAGFSGYYNRNMGPRGEYFKDWATLLMDTL